MENEEACANSPASDAKSPLRGFFLTLQMDTGAQSNGRVTFYQVQFGHNSYDGGALPPVSIFLIASAVDPSSSSHNSKCSIMRRSLLLIHDM